MEKKNDSSVEDDQSKMIKRQMKILWRSNLVLHVLILQTTADEEKYDCMSTADIISNLIINYQRNFTWYY